MLAEQIHTHAASQDFKPGYHHMMACFFKMDRRPMDIGKPQIQDMNVAARNQDPVGPIVVTRKELDGRSIAGSIGLNHDGRRSGASVFQLQRLLPDGSPSQMDHIARLKRQRIHFRKMLPGRIGRLPIVAIAALDGIHVIRSGGRCDPKGVNAGHRDDVLDAKGRGHLSRKRDLGSFSTALHLDFHIERRELDRGSGQTPRHAIQHHSVGKGSAGNGKTRRCPRRRVFKGWREVGHGLSNHQGRKGRIAQDQ